MDEIWEGSRWLLDKKTKRAQPQGHRQTHSRFENEVEIREMEGEVDPQGGIDPQSDH